MCFERVLEPAKSYFSQKDEFRELLVAHLSAFQEEENSLTFFTEFIFSKGFALWLFGGRWLMILFSVGVDFEFIAKKFWTQLKDVLLTNLLFRTEDAIRGVIVPGRQLM